MATSKISQMDRYTTKQFTSASLSLAGGARGSVTVDATLSGYTPIGVLSVYTNDTEVFSLQRYGIVSANTAGATFQNVFSDPRQSTVTFVVLYRKN